MATTNYAWGEPTPGGSTGVWALNSAGGLNYLHQQIDTELFRVEGLVNASASLTEQPLIIPSTAYTPSGTWTGGIGGVLEYGSINTGNYAVLIPLLHLRTGVRITGFTSYGAVGGTRTATVALKMMNTDGSATTISAGHALPLTTAAQTTTSGLTHDVVADKAYYIDIKPAGGVLVTDYTALSWVRLITIATP